MLTEWQSKGETRFVAYFRENYTDSPEKKQMWALAYRRRHTGYSEHLDNTTNCIESFHSVFKAHYLNRKSLRVDDVIEQLLTYEQVPFNLNRVHAPLNTVLVFVYI